MSDQSTSLEPIMLCPVCGTETHVSVSLIIGLVREVHYQCNHCHRKWRDYTFTLPTVSVDELRQSIERLQNRYSSDQSPSVLHALWYMESAVAQMSYGDSEAGRQRRIAEARERLLLKQAIMSDF